MANQESTQGDFIVPTKHIKDEPKDLPFFQTSEAYARIMSYILALNNAVLNRKVSDPITESEVTFSSNARH
jgi:serine/threonine-protein phosphatase 2A activator